MRLIAADDELFGNEYLTLIGETVEFKKMRPLIAWDYFGIAEVDGVIHFFEEDDGCYWSSGTLTLDEINSIRCGLVVLHKHLKVSPSSYLTVRFVDNRIPRVADSKMQFTYDMWGKKIHTITLQTKSKKLSIKFYAYCVPNLLKCFKLKERPPKVLCEE